MTLKRRLDRLESHTVEIDTESCVVLTLVGKTEDDVIGVEAERIKVRREPDEPFDDLVARARRQALKETPEVGLPFLVSCFYTEDRL